MPVFGVVCIVLGMVAGCISCLVLSKAADKAYGTVIDCLKDCQTAVSEEELNRLKDGAKATVGQKLVPPHNCVLFNPYSCTCICVVLYCRVFNRLDCAVYHSKNHRIQTKRVTIVALFA